MSSDLSQISSGLPQIFSQIVEHLLSCHQCLIFGMIMQ